MILTFNPQFVEPIKAGTKIHTIRTDIKGRWKPGMKIHFWVGNPRNVKKNPYQFQSGICTDVKEIIIDFNNNDILLIGIKINGCTLIEGIRKLDEFAQNDGFENWGKLKEWFNSQIPRIKFFKGKLIYFKVHATI